MRSLGRAPLLVLTLALATLVHPAGRASASQLEILGEHLRARGARDVREVMRGFLFEGQSSAYDDRLARTDCVGFLAFGTGEVRDVDLALYTHAGQQIAEDSGVAPFAYARVCGQAGLSLYASATMYAGRGELTLLRLEHAPRELGRLPSSIPFSVSAGGRLEELRAIGSASDDLPPEVALLQEDRAQAALGYLTAGQPQALALRAGTAQGQVLLRAGRCYRAVVVVPFSRGVAIEIESAESARWFTRNVGEDRTSLALCAPSDGAFAVRIQARPMRGVALLRMYEHRAADSAVAREAGESTALAIAEAKHVAGQRGLTLRSLGDAWVEGSAPLIWPLQIAKAGCYAFAAVSDVGAAGLDVRLTDASGTLLAHNEGRRGVPMVFACLSQPESVRVVLKARGPDLRVGVWLGQSDERKP